MYNLPISQQAFYDKKNHTELSEEALFFLKKVYYLEGLFLLQVQQISYNSKADIMHWEYNKKTLKKARIYSSIVIDNFSNPNKSGLGSSNKVAIDCITRLDSDYVNQLKFLDSQDVSEAEKEMKQRLTDFLCFDTINFDTRLDLYLSKADCYFDEGNRQFFIDYINSLRK